MMEHFSFFMLGQIYCVRNMLSNTLLLLFQQKLILLDIINIRTRNTAK